MFIRHPPSSAKHLLVITMHQLPIVGSQVHAVTLAIAPSLTVSTAAGVHPLPLAVGLKTVLPDVPETVAVDIPLMVVAAYAQAT